jgi:hypothetical protein
MEKFTRKTKKKTEHKTIGELVAEKNQEYQGQEAGVFEVIDAAHEDYESSLVECINNGKEIYDGDFFVTILQKVERLFTDVNRFYFFPRLSCPTPSYDQVVYKFNRKEEMLEFLWVIPDKNVCSNYINDPLAVAEDEKDLLNFVYDFIHGVLDRRCKKLNNEMPDDPSIVIRLEEN